MKLLISVTAFLIVAVLMHTEVRGKEADAPPPEMKALERFLGTWKVEHIGKIPEETRSTTIYKRELVLGGRFIQGKGFDDEAAPGAGGNSGHGGAPGTGANDANSAVCLAQRGFSFG